MNGGNVWGEGENGGNRRVGEMINFCFNLQRLTEWYCLGTVLID